MLKKQYRLRAAEVREVVGKKNLSLHTSLFSCRIKRIYPEQKESSRFAVIVSKKISKLSPLRHRIKRRIMQSLRPILQTFPQNLHIIIFPKHTLEQISFEELCKESTHLVEKLKKG